MNLELLGYSAFLSLIWLGLIALNAFRRTDRDNKGSDEDYRPYVLVILPCRGVDITLQDNLNSLASQKYGRYKVVAVVDSADDPAVEYLKKAGISHIIAGRKCKSCSGKVNAILSAFKKFGNADVYVIADSDCLFSESWLEELVRPLSDPGVGVSTTFPLFNPVGGFWSKVKMLWGFVGNGLMESEITRFAWGGSMAFRSGFADSALRKRMRSSVSDDIAVTKEAKRRGLGIYYAKKAAVKVNSDDSFAKFFEWSNRQTALSILGNRKLFKYGIIFYAGNILLFWSGVILSALVSPLYLVFLLPGAIGIGKACKRAGRADPGIVPIYLLVEAIYFVNLVVARRMRSIQWRGRTYALR
ncbi:MAG: glycosyltransferase family 2 protein [Candidatus Micrarchaeales archaeon]|uniref:Glycosyl transferase family 2 n=1 Tax=Candidatus Micrarchaeum acidiphilum ARMAN-2 TaxID=425595 RepID=C7DG42_MICA2|nr:MAG: glycosyl transferase family 2 [Candidatus Micrarchaeum acidiphilum ARMAN-2]MCW6161074.1 glycosyltransferase family 2 protein [Candidatus Micrarchaeales archaeon]